MKLKKEALKYPKLEVYGQQSREFWQGIKIRPDIVIETGKKKFIIDTKWKNIGQAKPTTGDLRQMFVYNDYWESFDTMLLYPSSETSPPKFQCFKGRKHRCAIGKLNLLQNAKLRPNIGKEILSWYQ